MNPVRHIRSRYILGLSALVVVIISMQFLMQRTIISQEHNGRVINIASSQIGLVNRIAFFTGQMISSQTATEFASARQQVGRAINRMRDQAIQLLNGDPSAEIPRIMTPHLEEIYFNPKLGLKRAQETFLMHAEAIYWAKFGELSLDSGDYFYVSDYGPFALESLLNAAVNEYETFNHTQIKRLERLEWGFMIIALGLVLLEIFLIFVPMERSIQKAFQALKHSRKEMKSAKIRAEDSNKAKTNFLLNMSHELRTPLNAIIGFTEGMEYGLYGKISSQKQKDCLGDIRNSGTHLLALVNDILDLSAAETGDVKMDEAQIEMSSLVSDVVGYTRGTFPKNAKVIIDHDSIQDLYLCIDERRTRQVLINLLSNALKFTPQYGTITLYGSRSADGGFSIAIHDTGIGMTAEEIAICRNRFGQAGDAFVKNSNGVGLGLPLSIELMKAQGGALDIESTKGVGTRATIRFPKSRVCKQVGKCAPVAA